MCGICGCGGDGKGEGAHGHTHAHEHAHGEAGHDHAHGEAGDTGHLEVALHTRILADNDHTAGHNRAHFEAAGVTAINLMGSPGSGKTALLEATRAALPEVALSAVSGDLATANDSDRLRAAGIKAEPITTGTVCHLDAAMIHDVLHRWADDPLDLFVIENVGNLVCPAIFDLGQAANVVCLSVTEGDDKPLKYPVMFREADLVVITKTDLLPHLPGSDVERMKRALAQVMPDPQIIEVSAITGEGLDAWINWLQARRAAVREDAA